MLPIYFVVVVVVVDDEDDSAVAGARVMSAICSKGRQVFSGIHHLHCNESGHQDIWPLVR